MKKHLLLLLILFACVTLFACSDEEKTSRNPAAGGTYTAGDHIDVDLSIMSSTMVFGEVFSMMMEPGDYLGKVIKMQGKYYAYYYEPSDKFFHCVLIEDAEACCQEGLEFMLPDTYTFPEDYPEYGTEVVITGVFSAYEEEGFTYYYIDTEKVDIISKD